MSGHNPKSNEQAFRQEDGQFICHIYATLSTDDNLQTISDIIQSVESKGDCPSPGWRRLAEIDLTGDSNSTQDLHVTLLRGHRAIYYHQIKPLVSAIKQQCDISKPFYLCLDKLVIFDNHERTKQFLCLATRCKQTQAGRDDAMCSFRDKLKQVVDKFAIRLTGEDETSDTLAHLSFMSRENSLQSSDLSSVEEELCEIEKQCEENLSEYPICVEKIDAVHLRVGSYVYTFRLGVS